MFKDFLMKKMLKSQGVPEEQIETVLALVNKDPELFKKIAAEIQEKMKAGKDQMQASMEVMMAHQQEIQSLMQK